MSLYKTLHFNCYSLSGRCLNEGLYEVNCNFEAVLDVVSATTVVSIFNNLGFENDVIFDHDHIVDVHKI